VLYREDYARANFQLLPVVEPTGASTGRQIVVHSLALFAVGLLPTTLHVAGVVYFATAFVLGLAMLVCGIFLARSYSGVAARRLLFVSLIYLPVLLAVMAIDKIRL
jgi:protoheme IX farnesyltransferase